MIGQQLLQGPSAIEKPIPIMYVEVDGTGVPMMPEELVGLKGKQPDGSSKTNRNEAQRRGIGSAQVVEFLGDGAAWVWELARLNFHGAVCILDFYHAVEHLNDLCKSLYAGSQHWISTMQDRWYDQMENDGIEDVILSAHRRLRELDPAIQPEIEKQIAYFENNKERMLYKTYRQKGFFYGSGVVEAGCKTVVGQRLKQSGMPLERAGRGKRPATALCPVG